MTLFHSLFKSSFNTCLKGWRLPCKTGQRRMSFGKKQREHARCEWLRHTKYPLSYVIIPRRCMLIVLRVAPAACMFWDVGMRCTGSSSCEAHSHVLGSLVLRVLVPRLAACTRTFYHNDDGTVPGTKLAGSANAGGCAQSAHSAKSLSVARWMCTQCPFRWMCTQCPFSHIVVLPAEISTPTRSSLHWRLIMARIYIK